MKVSVLYDINGTTTATVIEGHRVTMQLFVNGGGMCVSYDDKGEQLQCVMFAKVYVMDKTGT